ncbi:MAG: X-Pro dipeptidyl-peptidase, partial [Betaproteobacteria bacterium]|nr:X-Pro dipeptidyl-peptidase [Betaproteobacteria bacterium]
PVSPKLFVSTTGTDADWVVKLIDVYPADLEDIGPRQRPATPQDVAPPRTTLSGYQQLLRGNPLRARFRQGFEQPVPVEPGKVEPIAFDMPDVLHTFRRGHRIMVHVQSSWFPMIDRNPQTFVPHIKDAQPQDFKAATQRVVRSAAQPSGVEVWVLPAP